MQLFISTLMYLMWMPFSCTASREESRSSTLSLISVVVKCRHAKHNPLALGKKVICSAFSITFIPKFNVEEESFCSVGIHSHFCQYTAAEGTHIPQPLFYSVWGTEWDTLMFIVLKSSNLKDTFKEIKVRSLYFPHLLFHFFPIVTFPFFHIDFDKTFRIAGSDTDEGFSKHIFYFREPEWFIYIVVENYIGPV